MDRVISGDVLVRCYNLQATSIFSAHELMFRLSFNVDFEARLLRFVLMPGPSRRFFAHAGRALYRARSHQRAPCVSAEAEMSAFDYERTCGQGCTQTDFGVDDPSSCGNGNISISALRAYIYIRQVPDVESIAVVRFNKSQLDAIPRGDNRYPGTCLQPLPAP
eukprot:4190054-Pleurochrysis_carterae.AAC.3